MMDGMDDFNRTFISNTYSFLLPPSSFLADACSVQHASKRSPVNSREEGTGRGMKERYSTFHTFCNGISISTSLLLCR
jgi:hypothetical protein